MEGRGDGVTGSALSAAGSAADATGDEDLVSTTPAFVSIPS
jgi:hypothetical protein